MRIQPKVCDICGESSPIAKFSGNHKRCNSCRARSNREKQREYQRRYREKTRDYHRNRLREYRERLPHMAFYTTSRYLAKKAGVYSDLTKEDAYDIYNAPDICAYCGKERGPDDGPRSFHIDHVIPMVQGGPNSRWNLVKACISCNTSKGSASLLAFRERTPALTEERFNAIVSDMAARSGYSIAHIHELLTQSHAFEIAFDRERAKMESLLRRSRLKIV